MELFTRKNYEFYAISSAFQKSVRRGDEKKALFFAFELYSSGYQKYIWKRILIIASEDIGLADDMTAVKINALYNNWNIISEKANGSSVPFVHAVMILCRAEKSRICDHAKIYCMTTSDNFEIPDYAFDMHTKKGKMLKRSSEYFINEASKLNNEKDIKDDYKQHFVKYLIEWGKKLIDGTGYDKRNVMHKNPKELAKWKAEHNQTNLF